MLQSTLAVFDSGVAPPDAKMHLHDRQMKEQSPEGHHHSLELR